jgi:hypothetical protein
MAPEFLKSVVVDLVDRNGRLRPIPPAQSKAGFMIGHLSFARRRNGAGCRPDETLVPTTHTAAHAP